MTRRPDPAANDAAALPLVVVGASAGGLEPLEALFEAAPLDAGWCFVVVQHLSPDYKSMMHELLSRRSKLTIRHIEDGARLAPDTIFLNRPSTLATLEGDVFRTRAFAPGDGVPHLPIDALLSSLAARDPARTAAVILSGSGSDGTRGAESVHAAGGMVLVQSLAEAAFASMPRSALASEVADRVLPARDIPRALAEFFRTGARKPPVAEAEAEGPKSILKLLEEAHNLDFSDYKPQNVRRRIERRQHLENYADMEAYRAALERSPAALEELYHDLLIGVTEFYRDEESIVALRRKVFDALAAEPEASTPLRVWVAACSSGEEAYTIAIELSEALAAAGRTRSFRVIATDVHRRSIDIASAGVYSADAVARVPPEIRERYFDRVQDRYVVSPALRQKIIFSVHDVLSDPPFMNLDLVSCRNLLIYLTEQAQARLVSMFLFGLRKDGVLLLGASESLGRYAAEFQPVDTRCRLYRKATNRRVLDRELLSGKLGSAARSDAALRGHAGPRPTVFRAPVSEFRDRDTLIRCYDALLKRYAPSSILVTDQGSVLAWFGAAAEYIDTMNNLAEWTVEEVVHPDLHFVINVAAEKLRQQQLETYERRVTIEFGDGRTRHCDVRVEPLQEVQGGRLMLVGLKPAASGDPAEDVAVGVAPPAAADEDSLILSRRIVALERDLRLTEETLQHVTERLEASGEELQASNEELQASNEELQASNEELQSSNEELHAVNQELVSVSADHERQIVQLSDLNANIEQVLRMLNVGVIYVDSQRRVRRFSALIVERFALEPHDVMRSVDVIGPRPTFFDLPAAVAEVVGGGPSRRCEGDDRGERLSVRIQATEDPDGGEGARGAVLIFEWARPA
ncbi:CheR family methyltransferase [Albimonas pacifica]|uniref:Two-component system, chemotaxis family, CheB/CheR fusion protein n=1 Tax=Albimonas pacifica TaxID=1114924 RepID=A0A1I3MZ92_9RHOB|nr:CheR family methyltransferase [Albimonas pacifica]SFJ02291.1 two-component system, chemotaxis family, CheB/CheR fusion protein [Albimonas pacifica]